MALGGGGHWKLQALSVAENERCIFRMFSGLVEAIRHSPRNLAHAHLSHSQQRSSPSLWTVRPSNFLFLFTLPLKFLVFIPLSFTIILCLKVLFHTSLEACVHFVQDFLCGLQQADRPANGRQFNILHRRRTLCFSCSTSHCQTCCVWLYSRKWTYNWKHNQTFPPPFPLDITRSSN